MKKILVIVCVLVLLLLTSCNKEKLEIESDLYETTDEEIKEEEQIEDIIVDVEDKKDETVTDDIYEEDNIEVDIADLDIEDITTSTVDDPQLKTKMTTFLELFYYNIYFGGNDYSENGITEDDMVKFAISCIYQHDYNELKFDTESFILYVPAERVDELVLKYFNHKVSNHYSFEEENIMYEENTYLMPALDVGWSEEMLVTNITKAGDFAYEVTFEVGNNENIIERVYTVILELQGQRFVLTKYGYVEVE